MEDHDADEDISLIVLTICYCLSGQLKSLLALSAISSSKRLVGVTILLFPRKDFNSYGTVLTLERG